MERFYTQGASALALAVAFMSLVPQPGKAQEGPVQELKWTPDLGPLVKV